MGEPTSFTVKGVNAWVWCLARRFGDIARPLELEWISWGSPDQGMATWPCLISGDSPVDRYVCYLVHKNFRSSLAHYAYTNDRALPAEIHRHG